MEYITLFIWVLIAYIFFRISSWMIIHTIKLAFTVSFIMLGVLAMSSSVGLL